MNEHLLVVNKIITKIQHRQQHYNEERASIKSLAKTLAGASVHTIEIQSNQNYLRSENGGN